MRKTLALALFLTTSGAAPLWAQAVSPLGGSTNNPGSPPPALSTPAAPSATGTAPTTAPSTATAPATTAAPTTSAAEPSSTARHRTHAARTHKTLDERFAAANTTHDGKLTLTQAKAGHLRAVARDFAQIDTAKKGYVTLDEVKAHQADVRAARRAAREAKKTTP